MDAAKGIAILLVILDHLNTCKPLGNAISSFYMALFIMISGYFYHDGDWKKDIAKKAKGLMVPYLEYGIVAAVIVCIKEILWDGFGVESAIHNLLLAFINLCVGWAVYVIYFLFVLFVTTVLFILYKHFLYDKGYHIVFYLVIGLGCVAGYLMSQRFVFVPFFVDSALVGLVFYVYGWLYRRYEQKITWKENALAILLSAIIWIAGNITENIMVLGVRRYDGFPFCLIVAIAGCNVFLLLAYLADRIPGICRFLRYCGRNTLKILCINNIFVQVVDWRQLMGTENLLVLFVSQTVITMCICIVWERVKFLRIQSK